VSGRASRRLVAALIVLLTGVALATPVRVLAMSDGAHEIVASLDDGEALTYSYRQSIYDVLVYEEFVRRGDVIELLRVRSSDIRSIEYFRWDDTVIAQDPDGMWSQEAPPSDHRSLVVRIAPLGRQRVFTARWGYDLLASFGETVVTLSVAQRPFVLTLLGSGR
jgi:hypothetical protein